MASGNKVLERMNERVEKLSNNFDHYLELFNKSDNFVGPSIYFHHKTLGQRNKHKDVNSLSCDDLFFDYLYATLASWGMHRMGPGNTKLVDIEDIKESIKISIPSIEMLWDKSLLCSDISTINDIINILWNIISSMNVSVAEVKIVACSKTLHHILPDLVPPIDRSYTYNFIYNRTMLSIDEKEAFKEICSVMHEIGAKNKNYIMRWVGKGFNTSPTKVIDNAIMGFVMSELKKEK